MKLLSVHVAVIAALGGSVALAASPPFITRYTSAQLGGIASVVSYTVARPDREETRFVFLSAADAGSLPEEVQILDARGSGTRLADEKAADCTLAHVEIVSGRRPAIVSAVRVFSANQADDDQSAPALRHGRRAPCDPCPSDEVKSVLGAARRQTGIADP